MAVTRRQRLEAWLATHPLQVKMAGVCGDIDLVYDGIFYYWFSNEERASGNICFFAQHLEFCPWGAATDRLLDPDEICMPRAAPEWLIKGWRDLPPNVFGDAVLELDWPDAIRLILESVD